MGSSKKHKDKEKERDRDRKRDKDRRHRKRSRSRDRDDKDHERRREHRDSDGDRKKTRGGDDDDLFEYALQEIQNEQSGGPVQSHNEGSSGGGGSGDSLSIEETNKLRTKLGLKPLQVGDDKDKPEEKKTALLDDVHVPAKNMAEKTIEENMRRKLEEIREKRKIHQKLLKVKTLGDEDSDDDSAASWVKKSRKKEKEREMAEKRAKMLEEMDAEFGVGDLIKEEFGAIKQKSYTSRDLRGLTVQHDQTTFKDGMTTILTLKDQGILDDDGDTLVNVNIEDFEKANKNQELKKKKPTYQAYDDVDENDMFKVKGVLDKYDEEIDGEKKKTFALGAGGQFDTSQEDDLQKIKERLRNEMVSLEMAKPKIASEYYTEEEMLKFKKPKKKRKIRKREPLKADDLETIAGSSAMTSDHGSRSNKSRVQAPQQTNYGEEAMEIAPLEHEEQGNHFNPVPQENDNFVLEDDQAQLELEVALQRSRLAKKKKDKVGAEKVIQDLAAVTKQEQSTDKEGASIVIDSTSEFCRALGEIPTYGTSGNREEEEDDDDDDEWRMDIDHQSKETQGGWELVETQDEKKKIDVQKLEEESRVLDEEPIVGSGMAAALLLASKKGLLNAASKKKQEDKFVAELPSVGIIDEEKMSSGEGKDRGRRERDYDRDKDRYRVEKEGYVPKVKIDYVDEHGRQMTPKEAFRYLSHRFHGKMPAKLKTEKRNKKVMEDMAMQKMSSVDTPLNTAALLKDKQKESQSPYLILSGGGNTLSVGTTISKKK